MAPDNCHLITLGRISSTHGIQGQLRFHSYSGNLETLHSARELLARFPNGTSKTLKLKRAANHAGKMLLTFEQHLQIDQAQELVGAELLIPREELPATAPDEYYWHDLLGLSVCTDSGECLGTIRDIFETGANDVYLVKSDDNRREYLIPAISSVVQKVDLQAGSMIITPLDGLLDL